MALSRTASGCTVHRGVPAAVMTSSKHAYEVRPRKDHRGGDLISDALPFVRLWYQDATGERQFAGAPGSTATNPRP
jgi:hypothetical protein